MSVLERIKKRSKRKPVDEKISRDPIHLTEDRAASASATIEGEGAEQKTDAWECSTCGESQWWISKSGSTQPRCEFCHPPPSWSLVRENFFYHDDGRKFLIRRDSGNGWEITGWGLER